MTVNEHLIVNCVTKEICKTSDYFNHIRLKSDFDIQSKWSKT